MICPHCSLELEKKTEDTFVCSKGHGALITGGYLSEVREKPDANSGVSEENASADRASSETFQTHHDIACPNCAKQMHKVDYNFTGIIIDSCSGCTFRWLDAGEINKIKHHVPNLTAVDYITIAKLDERLQQPAVSDDNANPRLPLQGSYRAGSEYMSLRTGKQQIRPSAILGQGVYGLIKGLTHSKTSRILTLSTVAIFALLFILVLLVA